jgi:hypothetical protein
LPGVGVIAIQVTARRAPAKMILEGGIEMWTGQTLSLASGPQWRAEPVPPGFADLDWRSPAYDSLSWRRAMPTEPPPGPFYRVFDPHIFSTAFRGQWIRHPTANAQQRVWYETEWQCPRPPKEAWLRIATNRRFDLLINGRRAFTEFPESADVENGEWVLGKERDIDPLTMPEPLPPHEVGAAFARQTVEWPPLHDRLPVEPLDVPHPKLEQPISRRDPTQAVGGLVGVAPKALAEDYARGTFLAYNLTGLLGSGSV